MNNKLFQGLLIGSLLFQGAVILAADAAPKKTESTKPATKAEPGQLIVSDTIIKDSGVRYELTSCKREGETPVVVCRLLLTNLKKEDLAVSFKSAGTRFIDRDGEEYKAKKVKIGSVDGDDAENSLIAGTPTKAAITFDAPAANVLTMRVIAINHSPGTSLKFRNIKIGGK